MNPKLKLNSLPNPYKVAQLRKEYNDNLENWIGKWTHISGDLPGSGVAKTAKKSSDGSQPKTIHLCPNNSLICDLLVVQQNMVRFYDVTVEELCGSPLIFVLKLDEAEIVKNQKFERVSITLMNRALDSEIIEDNPKYFSVQSEKHIWPVASIEVSKETHTIEVDLFTDKFP